MTRPTIGTYGQTGHGGNASTLVGENSIQDWPSGLSYRDPTGRPSPVRLGQRQGGIFSSHTVLLTSFIDNDEMKRREKDKC